MNVLKEYTAIVSDAVDAPELFIKASGYYLVSNLLGRFFHSITAPHGRPNLWFLISSIPGRFRRSTLARYTDFAYTQALLKFHWTKMYPDKAQGIPLDDSTEDVALQRKVMNTIIEEGTPEGIADFITDNTKPRKICEECGFVNKSKAKNCKKCGSEELIFEESNTNFTIFSSEFGGVFKRMAEAQYMSGTLNLLSKLYYGEGGSMYLSKRGGGKPRYIPEGLYVTMFAGMQEPQYYIHPSMVRQGTMRRILLCYKERASKWKAPLRLGVYEEVYRQLKTWADKVADLMIKYDNSLQDMLSKRYYIPRFRYLLCGIGSNVEEKINNFAEELDRNLDEIPSDANIYKQSLWEHLTKLVMVRGIARGQLAGGGEGIMVHMEDLDAAWEFLEEVQQPLDRIIEELGEKRKIMESYREPLTRVYAKIYEAGDKGITHTNLLRKLPNWVRNQINPLIQTLQGQGRIEMEVVEVTSKKTGQVYHRRVYRAKKP